VIHAWALCVYLGAKRRYINTLPFLSFPMLYIGPLSVLSVLSVTLAYCGQRVRWIKMPLGREVGLGLCHVVLDGDPASASQNLPNGHSPLFSAHICCGQAAGWIKKTLGMWPRAHCVRWGPSSPPPQKGAQQPPFLSFLTVAIG